MDWQYLLDHSALPVVVGFVIAKLFEVLAERKQDRRLARQLASERERLDLQLAAERERLSLQLAGEKERIELLERGEVRKHFFQARFDVAMRITRMLSGSVQTLRSQVLAHGAAYSEGAVDVEVFRTVRDNAFDAVKDALRDGLDAVAVLDLLFHEMSFGELPHQKPLVDFSAAWQAFLRRQADFLAWIEQQAATLPPMLPKAVLTQKDQEISDRLNSAREDVVSLAHLVDKYSDGVTATIRILSASLRA